MTRQLRIVILHGPNLNRLGTRRPERYGHTSFGDITDQIETGADQLGVAVVQLQSNHEGALIDFVHEQQDIELDGIVINPAGLTPCGYSLLDAVCDVGCPFAVVHISPFPAMDGKQRSDIFAGSAAVYVTGAGHRGYLLALDALVGMLRRASS